MEEYTYSANNSKGISDEKILLNNNSTSSNWANSTVDNGTPGFKNSVTPINFDPGISKFPSENDYQVLGNSENFSLMVKNFGIETSTDFQI